MSTMTNYIRKGEWDSAIDFITTNNSKAWDEKDLDGWTILHSSVAINAPISVVQTIVNEASEKQVNTKAKLGMTALSVACQYNCPANIISCICNHPKIDVNAADSLGNTSLHYAVISGGSFEIVQILIDFGASIIKENNDKKTPLMLALERKRHDLEQILHGVQQKSAKFMA
jgi:ankyrin repeat protein